MYYPYFRGKQYELITIRECVEIIKSSSFVPIIEPVKSQLNGLSKTINVLVENDANSIVIANPIVGDFSNDNTELLSLIEEKYHEDKQFVIGLLLRESTTLEQAVALCSRFEANKIALIHSGFSNAKNLADVVQNNDLFETSIFVDGKSGKLYQKHFAFNENRIFLKNGFEKRRNADHPPVEVYSDLHVTYQMEGMTGFSDFLIVGDDYQESGGPAYTVAIHLTYIDGENEDIMYIRHFKSIRQNTPTDPAGKFAEALDALVQHLESSENKFYETSAILEFRELHNKGHYPGLGYVKKLAMKHHIETFAEYFRGAG